MILIWRGWGLLALVVLFPVLALCAGMDSVAPKLLIPLLIAASLLGGGMACVYYGTKWNRPNIVHTLYFLPLQAWGWFYLTIVAAFSLMSFAGGALRLSGILKIDQQKLGADKPHPSTVFIIGFVGLVAVVASGALLIRSVRSNRQPGGSELFPHVDPQDEPG